MTDPNKKIRLPGQEESAHIRRPVNLLVDFWPKDTLLHCQAVLRLFSGIFPDTTGTDIDCLGLHLILKVVDDAIGYEAEAAPVTLASLGYTGPLFSEHEVSEKTGRSVKALQADRYKGVGLPYVRVGHGKNGAIRYPDPRQFLEVTFPKREG